MPQVLKYRVENAQVVTVSREVTVDGVVGNFLAERAVIEAIPLDSEGAPNAGGYTFSMDLPADALAELPEGSILTVTVDAELPADEA